MTDIDSQAVPKKSSVHDVQAPDAMRRNPQQLRSRRMVNAIVESARQILEQEGRGALSTTALEVVSGVSKASIYQYFPNLDAVVAEVFHDVIRLRISEWGGMGEIDISNIESMVTIVVDAALTLHRELLELDPEFYRNYSGFYDLWQAFDETHQLENATMVFLKQNIERCEDFNAMGDTRLLAYALGRSVELTTYAMLRDDPGFLEHPEFRKILMRIGCAVLSR